MPFRGGGHGVIEIVCHMNWVDDAVPFRGGGHGVIEFVCHMNWVDDAVPLRVVDFPEIIFIMRGFFVGLGTA